MTIRIVAISDTHGMHERIGALPDGDILIHAGDFTNTGRPEEVRKFFQWFGKHKQFKKKIAIAGNHERDILQGSFTIREFAVQNRVSYLEHEYLHAQGLTFFGSPYVPPINGHWAFEREDEDRERLWKQVHQPMDILITHTPPFGIRDRMDPRSNAFAYHIGCKYVNELTFKFKPKVHIFGHNHEGHGLDMIDGTIFANVAICTMDYKPTNPITVIDI